MPPLRVIFMGTPDFAVPSLAALAERAAPGALLPDGLEIVAVLTRPDKPAGRGRQLAASPVKQYAVAHDIPVYQPGPLRRAAALAHLHELAPDLIVVAAFGQLLPPDVLALPPHGCLNVHASLLPRWRGASPINAAILAGDAETGVTIMRMDAGLDTGPIVATRATPIAPDETAGDLSDRLAALGAALLADTLPAWLRGDITPRPQDETQATITHLLRKEDGRLDWSESAEQLARQVRAMTPWPGAYTTWNGRTVKILRAHTLPDAPNGLPAGTCFLPNEPRPSALACICGQGALGLDVIQLEGKRPLPAPDVLRGHPTLATATLGN